MAEQAFEYYLWGPYIIELGRFFKGTFSNFVIQPGADPLKSQVFYGTPRAAFRYYLEQENGIILLPMINYYISAVNRLPGYEKTLYLASQDSYDPATGLMDYMRFPSIYEITYTINLWNNNLREQDYMLHTIVNSFPMGDAWLIHYPDRINHPDVWLPMPHTLDLTFSNETELDNLPPKETRDQLRTSFTLKCTRVFVPHQVYKVPSITWIHLDSVINEINGNKTVDASLSAEAALVKSTILNLGLSTAAINI